MKMKRLGIFGNLHGRMKGQKGGAIVDVWHLCVFPFFLIILLYLIEISI